MQKIKKHLIWGWIFIWGIAVCQIGALSPMDTTGIYHFTEKATVIESQESQEMSLFFKAKEHIFKSNWEQARKGFEFYLETYPDGRLTDEALYWLAQSLNRLSNTETSEEPVLGLKKTAVDILNELIEKYPKSLWWDDGLTLRVEIAGQMVILGQESYKKYITAAVESQDKSEKEIKLHALNSLIRLNADYVLPIFQRLLETDSDPEIRKRCALLLGRYFPSDSMNLLEKAARSDKNKNVREAASALIDNVRSRQIPVRLQYFVYGSRLLDESDYKRFPENKVAVVSLPSMDPDDKDSLLDEVRGVFNNKISHPQSSANGWMPYSWYAYDSKFLISNRAGDYQLWFPQDKIKITSDQIQGEIHFQHIETGQKHQLKFKLNEDENRMAVLRSKDRLTLVILQFRKIGLALEKGQPIKTGSHAPILKKAQKILARNFNLEEGQVFHTEFSYLMGWEIHSSRASWPVEDLTGKTGKYDFGKAEAISKETQGWKLAGHLLLLIKERHFIARKAVLADPDGKTFIGDEIIVPVDKPSDFKITGLHKIKEAEFESELPDYGKLDIGSSFTLQPGIKISTARNSFMIGEFEKPLVNFRQSKAKIAERGSPLRKMPSNISTLSVTIKTSYLNISNRTWTLLGDVFWLRDQNRLIGFGAILIDPEREIKAYGLISVPMDKPSAFRILRGKSWKKKQILLPYQERQTRYFYPSLHSNVQGWEVLTTLHSSGSGDEKKQDFSFAQATREYDGREWILIGQIMLLPKDRSFIAREAALINSDGEIVFGAELQVSTDNPSQYKVIKK